MKETTLARWYRSVFIAGATLGGGPPAAAAATAFLSTELGQSAIDAATEFTRDGGKPSSKPKPKRTKSAWQRYMGQKKNQIKYKSGPKKGRLDLSKMSRAYKRSRK